MAGRDTPSGTFRPNRMDADHHSQEWDDAPMPHTIFFDMHGHAVHGFSSITHLGNPASHGCVRLAPQNATILFDLVKMEKMHDTTVVITGQTPSQQSIAAFHRHEMIAANAPLTRESLAHRSSDQTQPYGTQATAFIKEAAAYQLPQTDALEALIPTPTFAMAGARWARRASAAQLAAYVPPAEPPPLSHEAYSQSHEPATSAERQAAAELRTASNEPAGCQTGIAAGRGGTDTRRQRTTVAACGRAATARCRAAASRGRASCHQQRTTGCQTESLQAEAALTPLASEPPLPHAAEEQQHRPAAAGRRHAASELETAVNEQPPEGEALEAQAPAQEAPAASGQPPRAYHRQQSYALPPTIPPSARLPASITGNSNGLRHTRSPITPARPASTAPRFYYVMPPTYGQQVYYYVQPGYVQPGYAQQATRRPQYYRLYGQY